MVRAFTRNVLAAVRSGAEQCVLGYEDPDDTAAREEAGAFLRGLATADPVTNRIGVLSDLGAVTDSLKAKA